MSRPSLGVRDYTHDGEGRLIQPRQIGRAAEGSRRRKPRRAKTFYEKTDLLRYRRCLTCPAWPCQKGLSHLLRGGRFVFAFRAPAPYAGTD